MSTQYAKNTTVAVDKTRTEIELLLKRFGAKQFGYAIDSVQSTAIIQFTVRKRFIRFSLPLPKPDDKDVLNKVVRGRYVRRSAAQQQEALEQGCRSRWRALLLCIKAKIESVSSGITTFEDEFLSYTVIPGGQTLGELVQPQIAIAYETGAVPNGIAGLLN